MVLKVIVDADACPRACLQVLQKHKRAGKYRLLTVASVDHRIDNPDHIMVGKGSDAADLAVINHTAKGDIVVTQDWGLAALTLGKGAAAISSGIYSDENIDFLLEERSLKAIPQRVGDQGPSRTPADDQKFEKNFLHLLERAQNGRCGNDETRALDFGDFGATGDLTRRKLYPALFNLWREGLLPRDFAIVCVGRRDISPSELYRDASDAVHNFSRRRGHSQQELDAFLQRLSYYQLEFHDQQGYGGLKDYLDQVDGIWHTRGNRVFFLAVAPIFFSIISRQLKDHGMTKNHDSWQRLVVEKPFARTRFGHFAQSGCAQHISRREHLPYRSLFGERNDPEHHGHTFCQHLL